MKLLVIDTSGADCAAATYDTGLAKLISTRQETIGKGHAERLPSMVDEALHDAGLEASQLDKIAVVVGPGSFTGIRVGVSFARGFALALGIPAVGVSALEAFARQSLKENAEGPLLSVIDAKRDQVYLQEFEAINMPGAEPAVMLVEDARAAFDASKMRIVGPGAGLIDGQVSGQVPSLSLTDVAEIAAARNSAKPAPLYLRGPDAKPQAGFAIARR